MALKKKPVTGMKDIQMCIRDSHHSQTGGCGQGCVKGIAAFFDHIQACLGSQGLGGADHSPAAIDKTAAGWIAVLERVKMKIHEISSLS